MSNYHNERQSDPSTRLTSLLPSTGGGLQPKRKQEPSSQQQQEGKQSLLGLDRLAAQKRQEQQFTKRQPNQQRSYRRSDTETPSHPGGVNREAYHRVRQQDQRHHQRGQRQYQPYKRRNDNDFRQERGRENSNYRRRDGNDRYNDYDKRRRDDSSRSRGSSNYRHNRDRSDYDKSRMPPPHSVAPVTPSTHATASTSRSNLRYKHESSSRSRLDAATPMSRDSSSYRGSQARRSQKSGWDLETPLQGPRDNDELPENPDDEEFDRHFYLDQEEGGYVLDSADSNDMGRFLFENAKTKAREEEMEKKRQNRYNPRHAALQDDQDAWEENRLLSSGAAVRSSVDLDMTTDQDTRVTLLVHQVKPPFLDGRVSFSRIREAVPTVRDASSDFAKMAREGSATLRHLRATKDKHAMRQKFWELGGTRMGDAVGVKKSEGGDNADGQQMTENGDIDYKKSSGFAQHMKKKDGPVSAFAKTKTIRQQREYLPVFAVRDELMNVLRENNCVVIVGETGSGKTTQLTQYLMEEGYAQFGLIGCTQPRRVAAMSVAKRVCEEVAAGVEEKGTPLSKKDELGGRVGYAIRFEDCTSEHTLIKYMTDGVLLRESLNDPDLNKYSCIVMDEAHERSLNSDVLFGVLRKVVGRRSDIKLIVTSATLSADTFSNYFGGVPVFRIPGRTFPVETYFAKSVQEDYVDAAVKQTMQIHFNSPPGDILIFMTGQEDIEGTCR